MNIQTIEEIVASREISVGAKKQIIKVILKEEIIPLMAVGEDKDYAISNLTDLVNKTYDNISDQVCDDEFNISDPHGVMYGLSEWVEWYAYQRMASRTDQIGHKEISVKKTKAGSITTKEAEDIAEKIAQTLGKPGIKKPTPKKKQPITSTKDRPVVEEIKTPSKPVVEVEEKKIITEDTIGKEPSTIKNVVDYVISQITLNDKEVIEVPIATFINIKDAKNFIREKDDDLESQVLCKNRRFYKMDVRITPKIIN